MAPTSLSYCMNVHPIQSFDALSLALKNHCAPIARQFSPKQPFPVGLWLSNSCIVELEDSPQKALALAGILEENMLEAFSVNAFPTGDFHAQSVKSLAYKPTWAKQARLEYSKSVARLLAQLLPSHRSLGSLSTVPLSFKDFHDDLPLMTQNIREMARFLRDLEDQTGKELVLSLEPEPFCVLETTAEAVAFFQDQLFHGPETELLRRHIGLCFDTCHSAVQWEDLPASIEAIKNAGIRIGKAQISVALEVRNPGKKPQTLDLLQSFAEPRYLHQSIAKNGQRALDLPDIFSGRGTLKEEWQNIEALRTHFHVPIFWDGNDQIGTTKATLKGVVPALVDAGCEHFEVETYSWNVIPKETRESLCGDLNQMIVKELETARALFG
jgi:sugar phosphate isomerase/epimerase